VLKQARALVEMGFAAAAVFGVASTLTAQKLLLAQWATLGGFAYVVSRGSDNVWEYRQRVQTNTGGIRHTTAATECRQAPQNLFP